MNRSIPIPRRQSGQQSGMLADRDALALSPGTIAIVLLAILSSLAIGMRPAHRESARTLWLFARPHYLLYTPVVERWNKEHEPVELRLLANAALERRMMAAFFAGTPSADLIEVERRMVGRAFSGPPESIGFVDLTDRIARDGLADVINAPSFSPWSSRGRVYGLPHDVHPVMLSYRADLVEAAGIDVSRIHTWDDFAREMAPLMADRDADGKPDRYLINMWENNFDHLEILLLQAGGGFFDESGELVIDSPANERVLTTVAGWCAGPGRIAADAPNFSAAGNQLKLSGHVVCSFMPDWMCDVWKHDMPQLAGKVKLMPLPAWDEGSRRTSVWGGTMLGIPTTAAKSPEDLEALWSFAKHLYLSEDLAKDLFRTGGIITPVKSHWSDPVFDEPSAYFCAQPVGRMYIDLAPHVPPRSSSPFNSIALFRVSDALVKLTEESRKAGGMPQDKLRARARELLADAQRKVRVQIDRNVFHRSAEQ